MNQPLLSDKVSIRSLVEICALKGIEYVVISPGSRNAPLNISFNEQGSFKCLSVPDERVAGFVALGIAQQSRKPVVVNCTSGSAALNIAPAIAEAFYQKIPLLIITADRPVEWIDQGINQTMRQTNIFQNYIKKSYQLIQEAKDGNTLWYNERIINEAIDQTLHEVAGPVHINIPLEEPLYNQQDYNNFVAPRQMAFTPTQRTLSTAALASLQQEWQTYSKKIILCGEMSPNSELLKILNALVERDPSVVVMTEATSNLPSPNFIECIDRVITRIGEEKMRELAPDLLVTIGGAVVSKKIKVLLRKQGIKAHWQVGLLGHHVDTYHALKQTIPVTPLHFFTSLSAQPVKSDFQALWQIEKRQSAQKHETFLSHTPWSDLKVFECLFKLMPQDTNLQLGNSTPVRYAQLFTPNHRMTYNANRGVSGIDGCTSTAVGAAIVSNKMTTVITGDIGFLYDSNAFWNHHLPANLRVIMINNGGGNIFRYIPGPRTTNQLEQFFETHHDFTGEHIAKAFHIPYYAVASEAELVAILPEFYAQQENDKPAILEIHTPRLENDGILRAYLSPAEKPL